MLRFCSEIEVADDALLFLLMMENHLPYVVNLFCVTPGVGCY